MLTVPPAGNLELHDYLERDLKGMVDGIKYTAKKGRLVGKKIPSLLDKIQYVTSNMQRHGFDPVEYRIVQGVILIEDFPPINEYKGIKIIGLGDVQSLQ